MSMFVKGTTRTLRAACVKAAEERGLRVNGLLMDRSDGTAYAALFLVEESVLLAEIPDRFADTLEICLTRYKDGEMV